MEGKAHRAPVERHRPGRNVQESPGIQEADGAPEGVWAVKRVLEWLRGSEYDLVGLDGWSRKSAHATG